jgi:hypothetical protein
MHAAGAAYCVSSSDYVFAESSWTCAGALQPCCVSSLLSQIEVLCKMAVGIINWDRADDPPCLIVGTQPALGAAHIWHSSLQHSLADTAVLLQILSTSLSHLVTVMLTVMVDCPADPAHACRHLKGYQYWGGSCTLSHTSHRLYIS